MTQNDLQNIEAEIANFFGWVKYDQPEDKVSAFYGLWVEEDGKTGHDISKLAQKIAQLCSSRELAGRIDEQYRLLKQSNVYGWGQTFVVDLDVIKKRIAELEAGLRDAVPAHSKAALKKKEKQ